MVFRSIALLRTAFGIDALNIVLPLLALSVHRILPEKPQLPIISYYLHSAGLIAGLVAILSDRVVDTPPGTGSQARTSGVSLSAVLNAIDGPGAKEKRVLFMTINHRENLDPALIRPSRIDENFYLGYATTTMIKELFFLFFKSFDASKAIIQVLADKFASEIPDQTFTAAEIQSYLLRYKDSPEMAVSNAADWAKNSKNPY